MFPPFYFGCTIECFFVAMEESQFEGFRSVWCRTLEGLEEDVDIRYIQQLLGHSSITTTQIYTHVAANKQKDILTTKHPRNKMHTG